MLVAPASADFIAKLAQGRADDLLSLLCLARPIERCPLLVAPAMNREMWAHPATQRNVAQLRADGATVLGPASGDQACGEIGDGRMLEPDELLEEIVAYLQPKVLRGERMLITAGPTFEAIDPVRGITNLSSGKMGFAIARAAREAGADVTLVAGPGAPADAARRAAHRRQQRAARCTTRCCRARAEHGVFVATAAVADWRPGRAVGAEDQEGRQQGAADLRAGREPRHPGRGRAPARSRPYCVGFAAESHDLLKHAREKLERKRVPLIVGNLGPATFGPRRQRVAAGRRERRIAQLPADGRAADKLVLARARLVREIAFAPFSTHRA